MTLQIKTNTFIATAMYFILGLLSYLLIGEYSVFVWSDPWIYIYMVFWPFIWIWVFVVWVLIIGVVIGIIFFACTWWEGRNLRKIHKSATQIRQARRKKP